MKRINIPSIAKQALGVVFLTLLFASLVFLTIDLSSKDAAYVQAASEAADKHASAAKDQEKVCLTFAPLEAQKCVAQARDTRRKNEREEYNLAAQETTAWWTKIMGVAALIGMAVGLIGVFLVFITFGATRNANAIARDTADRQLRAYVTPDTLYYHVERGQIEIIIANHGQTPAHDVTVVTEYSVEKGRRLIQTQPFGIIDPKHPRYVGIEVPLIVGNFAISTHIWVTIHYRTFEPTQNPYCRTQQFKILPSTKVEDGKVGGTLVGEGSCETNE